MYVSMYVYMFVCMYYTYLHVEYLREYKWYAQGIYQYKTTATNDCRVPPPPHQAALSPVIHCVTNYYLHNNIIEPGGIVRQSTSGAWPLMRRNRASGSLLRGGCCSRQARQR